MSHPFEGWSALNEGWNPGDVPIDEIVENLKTVAKNFAGPVGLAFLAMWAVKVLVSILIGSMMVVGQVASVPALFTAAGFIAFLGVPVAIIVSLLQSSLYRPLQLQAFEGKPFVSTLGEAFSLAKAVVGKVAVAALLYGVSVGIGAIGCLIGALVPMFFFCQAPYLAATTELSSWECMRRSYELNKAYFMPVLIALAATMVIGGGLAGCGGAIFGIIGGALGSFSPGLGQLVSGLGSDFVAIVTGGVLLVVTGALFTTVQSVERGIAFTR